MELAHLENQLIDLQNQFITQNIILSELWKYHPSNPEYINVIHSYNYVKQSVSDIESRILDLEQKIKHVKSEN